MLLHERFGHVAEALLRQAIEAAAPLPSLLASAHFLGPYEIVASIGAGGMGEVWRAKDIRLEREVAIKVLPPGFADDDQLRQRIARASLIGI